MSSKKLENSIRFLRFSDDFNVINDTVDLLPTLQTFAKDEAEMSTFRAVYLY